MARERTKCEGIFRGLYIGEHVEKGVYPAIARGECRVIPYIKNSLIAEVLQFEEDLVNTLIQVDRQKEKKITF